MLKILKNYINEELKINITIDLRFICLYFKHYYIKNTNELNILWDELIKDTNFELYDKNQEKYYYNYEQLNDSFDQRPKYIKNKDKSISYSFLKHLIYAFDGRYNNIEYVNYLIQILRNISEYSKEFKNDPRFNEIFENLISNLFSSYGKHYKAIDYNNIDKINQIFKLITDNISIIPSSIHLEIFYLVDYDDPKCTEIFKLILNKLKENHKNHNKKFEKIYVDNYNNNRFLLSFIKCNVDKINDINSFNNLWNLITDHFDTYLISGSNEKYN